MMTTGNPNYGPENQRLSAVIYFYDVDEADRMLKAHKFIKYREKEYCLSWYQ